jgi:cyclophilin family peptidyl-prolyl cis-trans isomerase/HEAT repeat protein
MRYPLLLGLVTVASFSAACGGAPLVAPKIVPVPPDLNLNLKMSWILRLEDQRILRASAPPAVVEPPAPPNQKNRKPAATPPPPPPLPDLPTLVADTDARIRRRAALAIGRVGLPEGVAALLPLLTDADADVRLMAAFGLGLLADKSAVPALTTALQDADPHVRGRAAEALGLIGDTESAAAVGQMVAAAVKSGAIASIPPDDEQWPKSPEADAVRLGLFALVRQKGYEPLAAAIEDSSGRVSGWWPVAYALQRINDRRAIPTLQQLARTPGRYTRAFAARGLGALKDAGSVTLLRSMLDQAKDDPVVAPSVVRALGQIGAPEAAESIIAVLTADKTDPNLRLEAVTALAALKSHAALPYIQELLTDDWPTLRAAAVRATAAIDPEGFLAILSGMEPDQQWGVRAAIADTLPLMAPQPAVERLRALLDDQDKRVVPTVIESLARLKAPGLDAVLFTQLKTADIGIRAAAARAIGESKPAGGAAALRDAYRVAEGDNGNDVRDAVITALATYGGAEATDTLKTALADRDWALRLKAAALLKTIDPSIETRQAIRPAPGAPIAPYDSPELVDPKVSPHAFIETAKGTIEIELAVLDAPQTTQNFVTLARKGYFNGLQIQRVVPNFVIQGGDPRGDGSGGPGYSIRDELNDRPYLRGTVGMALSGPDTGGSQFFITHSPQPHLDAKYTVFGHVVNGMEIVDRIQQLDVIQRIRIWDGKELK